MPETMSPEPHCLDGKLEPEARDSSSITEAATLSIAISLKRIADAMTGPVNAYGETVWEATPGEMRRGSANGRY